MAQGQMYTISAVAVASPAAIWDLLELNCSSSKITRIHSIYIGQTSDLGDAQAEAITLQFLIGHTTSGSGGGTYTPVPLSANFVAAGATAETNNTTIASGGTSLIKHADAWYILGPYQYRPTPEERIDLAPSARFVIRGSAPADSITTTYTVIFEEIG